MDLFKYGILKETLAASPLAISADTFEEAVITLSREDLDELFYILTETAWPKETAKHIMELIQILWHYR